MTINDKIVASVDMNAYIASVGVFVTQYIERGYEPYMVTFMFKLALLKGGFTEQKMRAEIARVYARFLTECVRHPWSKSNRCNRPVLIACPDWPIWKRLKMDLLQLLPWEGPHWGSILLVPPWNRLKNGVKDHFEIYKRDSYVGPGFPLSRIHVEHIGYQPSLATDYVLKSLRRGKCSFDDLLIFPLSDLER